jgi:hypothetical protein
MKKVEVIKNNKGQFTDVRISSQRSVETMSFDEYIELIKNIIHPTFVNFNGGKYDFDEDYYDEIYKILAYAHPEGAVKEAKMKITKHETGSINVPEDSYTDLEQSKKLAELMLL